MTTLPKKRNPRDKTLSIKIQRTIFKKLKKISRDTGLSQPDIIEHLIESSFLELKKNNQKTKT